MIDITALIIGEIVLIKSQCRVVLTFLLIGKGRSIDSSGQLALPVPIMVAMLEKAVLRGALSMRVL
ncbi:MAG: hypothetical protein CMN81_04250 [Spongiibacter sp.]|nr:hypothetical protein [Spongiibacter sp.]